MICFWSCFLGIFWALPLPPGGGCGSGYRLYASRWRARIPALSLARGLRPLRTLAKRKQIKERAKKNHLPWELG
jgi:hypothetical protein